MSDEDKWVEEVERRMRDFSDRYTLVYSRSEREISASFEIGCFHSLLEFYGRSCMVIPRNLTEEGEYRYLTSPNGNPKNFSFVLLRHDEADFELRQQVRVRSHLHSDIAFTPDLVIVPAGVEVHSKKDQDYAGGKRSFFAVESRDVIAAHECKSMNPFPELLISFIGMLIAAHAWLENASDRSLLDEDGLHLAPSLFIGGTARALHVRMVTALESCYPINIILGLHSGTWSLLGKRKRINLLRAQLFTEGEEFGDNLLFS